MSRARRIAAWSAALAAALAIHGVALAWLAPGFEPRGAGAPGERGAGVRLARVAAPTPAPDPGPAPPEAARAPAPRPAAAPPRAAPKPPDAPRPTRPPERELETRREPEAHREPEARREPEREPEESREVEAEPGAELAALATPGADPSQAPSPEPAAGGGASEAREAAASESPAGSSGAGRAGVRGDARRRYEDLLSLHVQTCLRYPKRAARRRIRGEVDLSLRIGSDGALVDAGIVRGSGAALLDRDALDTVERCAPYPPPPSAAGGAGEFGIRIGYDPP
ncbi:MAG: energy transducer TonB [Myxococcota bacterium]